MENNDYAFDGTLSSTGDFEIHIQFSDKKKLSKVQQEKILARLIDNAYRRMVEEGSIRLLSPTDISKTYGNSRQYWEKLINEGKIPYAQTASGKITTNLWVEGYINQSPTSNYPSEVLEIRRKILKNEEEKNKRRVVPCSRCGKDFHYNFNEGRNINGICGYCNFKLKTIK